MEEKIQDYKRDERQKKKRDAMKRSSRDKKKKHGWILWTNTVGRADPAPADGDRQNIRTATIKSDWTVQNSVWTFCGSGSTVTNNTRIVKNPWMKNGEYCLHAEQYYWTVPELLFTWTRRPALLDMGSCKPQVWKFRNYWSETRDVTPMNMVRDTILRLSRHLPAFFPKNPTSSRANSPSDTWAAPRRFASGRPSPQSPRMFQADWDDRDDWQATFSFKKFYQKILW